MAVADLLQSLDVALWEKFDFSLSIPKHFQDG